MQVAGKFFDFGIGGDQTIIEHLRVRSHEADASDAVNFGKITDEQREVGKLGVMHESTIGVDVLSKQYDFAHAVLRKVCRLGEHVVERARKFLAAGERHH